VSQLRVDPALDQGRLASPIDLPLFPLQAPETVAHPAVQVSQHRWRLAEAKVAHPPSEVH
jgi:hypothetical protein